MGYFWSQLPTVLLVTLQIHASTIHLKRQNPTLFLTHSPCIEQDSKTRMWPPQRRNHGGRTWKNTGKNIFKKGFNGCLAFQWWRRRFAAGGLIRWRLCLLYFFLNSSFASSVHLLYDFHLSIIASPPILKPIMILGSKRNFQPPLNYYNIPQ